MNSLTCHSVVDQMTLELAERRRTAIGRKAAYIALARAIVGDELPEMQTPIMFERFPTSIAQPQVAA